ncbi:MAG: tetratricopeptide repeat protein [Terriglobia bacterium]
MNTPRSTNGSPSRARWSDSTLVAMLALAAVLPYVNTLFNAFVYDDLTQVLNNPYILNFHHLRQIFGSSVWSYIGQQGVTNYYRPLMTFGYLLCYQAFGKVAFGFHLVNVALHAAVVCLLFALTLALFKRRDLAFAAALIFALQPVHTESVAWIAAITDVELTFFYLLAFLAFVRIAKPDGGCSDKTLVVMAISFALALLSKEQALTLPVLATIYEHAYRGDRKLTTWTQKFARYRVLWLLTGSYLVIRVQLLGALAPVNQMPALTWAQAVYSALALSGQYIAKTLWPRTLCAFYVFHPSKTPLDSGALAGLAACLLVMAAFLALWRRSRTASFGFIWFFATLLPVLNARWMAANVFAERYLYLPSVGICWVLGWCAVSLWGAASIRSRRIRWALAACFGIVLALYAGRIVTRNSDWKNDVQLYTRTLIQQPEAYEILNNLGTIYWGQGRAQAARREWTDALSLHKRNTIVLNNLGLYYASEKRYPEAVSCFERAMRLKPAYTDPHLNLGSTYVKMGRDQAADLQLRAATELAPLNVRAHNELASLYLRNNEENLAEQQFRLSARSEPNVTAFDELGKIEAERRRFDVSEAMFKRALALNRYDSVAHFGLASIFGARGRTGQAEKEYQAGLETDPANAQAQAALQALRLPRGHGRPGNGPAAAVAGAPASRLSGIHQPKPSAFLLK